MSHKLVLVTLTMAGLFPDRPCIHERAYVHGDIKASNLLLSCTRPDQVYLADHSLAYWCCPEGIHTEYKEDRKDVTEAPWHLPALMSTMAQPRPDMVTWKYLVIVCPSGLVAVFQGRII